MMGKNKYLPLGRYLRKVIRDEIGYPDDLADQKKWEWQEDALLKRMFDMSKNPALRTLSTRQAIVAQNAGQIASINARAKLTGARRL